MGDKLDLLRNLFVYKGSRLYVYVYREAMKIITVEHIRRVVRHVRGLLPPLRHYRHECRRRPLCFSTLLRKVTEGEFQPPYLYLLHLLELGELTSKVEFYRHQRSLGKSP